MSDKKTETVTVKRVDDRTVTTTKGTSGKEYFPDAKPGEKWQVTTVGNDSVGGGVIVSTRKEAG